MKRRETQPVYTPSATYRLQFNQSFTFEDATGLVDYLDELGITDIYASPFLMARPGSMHGYDVTDQSRFNPEIGDEDSFLRLSAELQRREMGLIADVVPNHMCISHPSNAWWWDVLENGPSSPFARYFDIDWHPPKEELVEQSSAAGAGGSVSAACWRTRRSRLPTPTANFTFPSTTLPLPLAPAHLDHDPGTGRGQAAREAGRRSTNTSPRWKASSPR